jgi:putative restriction endonuclease
MSIRLGSNMTPETLIRHFARLNVWTQGDIRAPHKPLLLLLALANLQQGKPRLMSFGEIEDKLEEVITAFGPNRPPHPEYPFWHLRSEKIWEVPQSYTVPTTSSGDADRKYLRDHKIQGGFSQEAFALLSSYSDLLERAAMILLDDNYPSSIHQDVLDGVGLEIDVTSSTFNTSTANPNCLMYHLHLKQQAD